MRRQNLVTQLRLLDPIFLALEQLNAGDFASGEGIRNGLCRRPRQYSVLNEASFLFGELTDTKNPHAASKRRALLMMYPKSGRNGKERGVTHSKEKDDVHFVLSPSLTIVAEGQPARFYEALSETEAEDGILNRFDVFDCSRNHRGKFNSAMVSQIDSEIVARLRPLATTSVGATFEPTTLPTFIDVQWAEAASARRQEYIAKITDQLSVARDALEYQLFGRSDARIMQYAALLAIADNATTPISHWHITTGPANSSGASARRSMRSSSRMRSGAAIRSGWPMPLRCYRILRQTPMRQSQQPCARRMWCHSGGCGSE